VGVVGCRVMATTFNTHHQHGPAFGEAAAQVLLLDPAGLDVDGLKTSIGLCGTLRGIVSAAEAGFVAELERRAGRHEATEALRKKQKVSPAKAKRRSKTSKTTSEHPELAAALAEGDISEEHADVIADADQAHPDAGATAALLDHARGQSVEQFRHTAKGWERDQQGDKGEAEAERQHNARKVRSWIRPEDGMGVTIAELDPENHATFITALAWWVRKLKNNHNSGSKTDPVADRAIIASTPEQLLADALVAMASASTNPAGAGSAIATARMLVITNYDIATRTLTGHLPDGTVLTPETVRRLACDAEILPAVLGSDSQLLNLGMSARTATTGQRATLAERDGGCRGCGALAEFCVAHHIIHWAAQGPTDLDNLMLLCSRCHHLVHEGGYTVHKGPDGKHIIIAPKHNRPPPHTDHANPSHGNNRTSHPNGNATNSAPSPNTTNHADRTPDPNSTPSARGTPNPNWPRGPSETGRSNRNPETDHSDTSAGNGGTPSTHATSQPNATPGNNGDMANGHPKTSGTSTTNQPSRAPDTNDANDASRSGNASPNGTNDPSQSTRDHDTRQTRGTNGTPNHSTDAPSTNNKDHNTPDPGTNGDQRTNSVPTASRTRETSDDAKSNGTPGQSTRTPNGTHRTNRPPSPESGHRRTPESDTNGSKNPAAPPKGPRGRKRNPIVEQCLTDARQANTNTPSQPDLFGYAT